MPQDAPEPVQTDTGPARWRWGGAAVLVALAWLGAAGLRHAGEPIELAGWSGDYAQAQAAAAESGRPMLLLFTADWCPPCRRLKQEVLAKPEALSAAGEGFIPVKVDLTDNAPSNPNVSVAEMYGVENIPTLITATAEGETIGELKGERSVASFTAWLDGLRADRR